MEKRKVIVRESAPRKQADREEEKEERGKKNREERAESESRRSCSINFLLERKILWLRQSTNEQF